MPSVFPPIKADTIGDLAVRLGLDPAASFTQALHFFVYDTPKILTLLAVAIVSMLNQFCYVQLATPRDDGPGPDDAACIRTLANVFYRAVYTQERHPVSSHDARRA